MGLDVETCDPSLRDLGPGFRRGGFVAGVSLAIDGGPAMYLPLRHAGGGNMDEAAVWAWLRDQASRYRGEVCGLNLPYDLEWLLVQGGVWFGEATCRDAGVAEALIDELQLSYSLDSIAKRRGLEAKREDHLRAAACAWGVDPKSGMWRLPARHVGEYAEHDARLPLQLLRLQEKELEGQDLLGVWDLESRLLPVLVKMRHRGVAVDLAYATVLEDRYLAEETKLCQEISSLSGRDLLVDELENAGALAAVLRACGIDEATVGLTKGRKNKKTGEVTGRQLRTDADTLVALPHPVGGLLVRAKRFHKLRCTFVGSVRRYETGGRVHPTFRQVRGGADFGDDDSGARYGRTSCVDPNLQQQPNPERDPEIAGDFRRIYVPDQGRLWACCDYSQQEPRLLAHFAEAYAEHCAVPWGDKAREFAGRYREDPKVDNHSMVAEMVGSPCPACRGSGCGTCKGCGFDRKNAKTILLGKMYGMGGGKLCTQLGLPLGEPREYGSTGRFYQVAGPEGQAIIDRFDAGLPHVKGLAEECRKAVNRNQRGWIRTLSGRRCRFPWDPAEKQFDFAHKALNRLIQGSAGDQMKKALVDLDAAGFAPQLVVHDEVDLSVESREEAEAVAEVMARAYDLRVPFRVDVEVGDSWGTVK